MPIIRRAAIGLAAACCAIALHPVRTAAATQLSASSQMTCAIADATRELFCWGRNNEGQLGDGTLFDRAAPVIAGTPGAQWRSAVAGANHSCGIAANGAVYCWGKNTSGEVGDGTLLRRTTPVAVVGLGSGAVQLTLGFQHSCALMQDGKVNCWGEGAEGRLGSGATTDQTTPGEVQGLDNVLNVNAGTAHTCATLAGGTVKCWGLNSSGQIGDGSITNRLTPVFADIAVPVAVAHAANAHSCVLSSGGGVYCWGRNAEGQLGDGTTTPRLSAVATSGMGSGVTRMIASGNFSCAAAAGSLKCWGQNNAGQLGNGTTTNSTLPISVAGLAQPFDDFALGADHVCVHSAGDHISCWGNMSYGRAGLGSTASTTSPGYPTVSFVPTLISGLPAPIQKLSMRLNTTCAVTQQGGALCWGYNDYGQVGDGSALTHGASIHQSGPRPVYGLASAIADIAAGQHHACALKTDGTVWCWGRNQHGQLADQTTVQRFRPVQSVGITNAAQLASGSNFSCVRTAAGAVWCWGQNTQGQLGNGSTTDQHQPVAVSGLGSGVAHIGLGLNHACAVLGDGAVRCWGLNANGQVGDGSLINRTAPVAVNDGFGVYAKVWGGEVHSCGLTTAGQVKCWGANALGQLGDTSTTQRPSPAGVEGLTEGVTQLAVGYQHACALRGSELRCWGSNNHGQLGDNTLTNRLQPVLASNVSGSILGLYAGQQATCARFADNATRCWGYSLLGQLGNGGVQTRSLVPERVSEWLINDLIFRDGFDS
jgi:alpha-tubulin suppressor-like RCC1 family protein